LKWVNTFERVANKTKGKSPNQGSDN
jgi:hypothetical protein